MLIRIGQRVKLLHKHFERSVADLKTTELSELTTAKTGALTQNNNDHGSGQHPDEDWQKIVDQQLRVDERLRMMFGDYTPNIENVEERLRAAFKGYTPNLEHVEERLQAAFKDHAKPEFTMAVIQDYFKREEQRKESLKMTDRELLEFIAGRVGTIETKVDSFDTKVDRLETKVDRLETKVDSLETKVDNVETRMDRMEVDMAEVRTEVQSINNTVIRMEVVHTDYFKALFDGNAQHASKLDRIEKEVSRHEEVILRKIK